MNKSWRLHIEKHFYFSFPEEQNHQFVNLQGLELHCFRRLTSVEYEGVICPIMLGDRKNYWEWDQNKAFFFFLTERWLVIFDGWFKTFILPRISLADTYIFRVGSFIYQPDSANIYLSIYLSIF